MARTEEPTTGTQQDVARVYVNDKEVDVRSANPTVREVVEKAGYDPGRTDCYRLRDAKDRKGELVSMETVLRLGSRNDSVFLRCIPKGRKGEGPGVAPGMTTEPSDDPRRGLGVPDLSAPAPRTPDDMPPPGPPGLM